MTIFGFDLTSAVELWLLGCVCTGFADGIVRGFWRAWQEHKEQKKEGEKNA